MPRGSKPGERRGGRKKGTPNKTTADVKAAIEEAFYAAGGPKAFGQWAKANQTEFYTRILVKILPKEIEHRADESFSQMIAQAFGGVL